MTASLQRGTTASASEKVFNAHVIVMVCPFKVLVSYSHAGIAFPDSSVQKGAQTNARS